MVKRRLCGIVATLCFYSHLSLAGSPPPTAVIGTPPQPAWSQLDSRQKGVLAPLATDWDGMGNIQRKKWLGIAEHYTNLSQDQKIRLQERMREWAELSPDQRSKARDRYKGFSQLPDEKKQIVKQKWEAYISLPKEERQRLRTSSKSTRLLETSKPESPPPITEEEKH